MQSTSNSGNSQHRSTAAIAGPSKQSGPPAQDERGIALPLFREAGRAGINRLHFLRGTGPLNGRLITQIGRLINTLEKEGYIFLHEKRHDSRFVYYSLIAEPNESGHPMPKAPRIAPAPARAGWKAQSFSYGRPENRPMNIPVQRTLLEELTTASGNSSNFLASEMGELNW